MFGVWEVKRWKFGYNLQENKVHFCFSYMLMGFEGLLNSRSTPFFEVIALGVGRGWLKGWKLGRDHIAIKEKD